MMRFSGQEVSFDVSRMPRGLASRFAGRLPQERPDIVERIKSSILPNESGLEPSYDNAPSESPTQGNS